MVTPQATSRRLLRRMLLRSLLIQAAWNYRGMQHLGLLWAQLPAIEELPGDRREALLRAFEFYNAHPYLCGCLLGAAARIEQDGQGASLGRLKRAAIPPLGALGDRLFWAGLRPLTGLLGVTALLLCAARPMSPPLPGWIGIATSLIAVAVAVLYNVPHLIWRRRTLLRGWEQGMGIAAVIRELSGHRHMVLVGVALSAISGAALPLGIAAGMQAGSAPALVVASLFLATALASHQLPRRPWAMPTLLAALIAAWTL